MKLTATCYTYSLSIADPELELFNADSSSQYLRALGAKYKPKVVKKNVLKKTFPGPM